MMRGSYLRSPFAVAVCGRGSLPLPVRQPFLTGALGMASFRKAELSKILKLMGGTVASLAVLGGRPNFVAALLAIIARAATKFANRMLFAIIARVPARFMLLCIGCNRCQMGDCRYCSVTNRCVLCSMSCNFACRSGTPSPRVG